MSGDVRDDAATVRNAVEALGPATQSRLYEDALAALAHLEAAAARTETLETALREIVEMSGRDVSWRAKPIARAALAGGDAQPEGREGIVTVYDSVTGKYLGCMGTETWVRLLAGGDAETPR